MSAFNDFLKTRWIAGAQLALLIALTAPQWTFAQDTDPDKLVEAIEAEEPFKDELEETLAGHSYHGEAFNEGPRQNAYLMGGTGNVKFPVTTENKSCQNFINQGLGQIHGFWDLEAERSFRQAVALDKNCAMAYWGCALATLQSPERAKGFIDFAKELKEGASEREKMYINSLAKFLADEKGDKKSRAAAYLRNLEDIVLAFPNDIEAKALVAHRVWENSRDGIPVASYLAVDSLLQDIFDVEPLHPAHHYSIHLWDYRKPEKAVLSAARCGPSAPSIAHMWHMPGHIYSRLKRYEDAVYQQEASARVDHAHMMRDGVMPDQIFNFSHNNEWLIRNLVYLGRMHDAVDLAKNMIALPRHPKYNTLEKRGSADYGRTRLIQTLREYQLFDLAINYCNSVYLLPTEKRDEQIKRLRLLGVAYCMLNNPKAAEEIRAEMQELIATWESELKVQAEKLASLKKQAEEQADLPPVPKSETSPRQATKEEQRETKKKQGEIKREIKSAKKALGAIEGYEFVANEDYEKAYETLKKAGGEDVSFLGELQMLSGKSEEGLKTLQQQVDRRKNEAIPVARLIYFLHKTGDTENARKNFEYLRGFTNSAALDIELFSRLTPIAEELGYGTEWLLPPERLADVGFRPALDSLGPFRWSPSTAPQWSLPGMENETVSHELYAGRPALVIFYLGHGCLHCAEQLQAFGPKVPDFRDQGIDVIAISTDDLEGLNLSVKNYGGDIPMELVADPEMKVFKKFRAYDDFEKQALHGTFLIDADGKIRWQDISYEPFMDHEFVLNEAKRLLAQESKPTQISSN